MAADPSTTDALYSQDSSTREMIDALWGGTSTMQAAGEKFLPKEQAEDATSYESRLKRSVLFGAFRKTCEDMADKIFAVPVSLKEDETDKTVIEWSENIDLAGTALNNFAYELCVQGMRSGISYVYVDMPVKQEGATLADEKANNHRPYFVIVKKEDLLSIRSRSVGNRQVLSQIRMREFVQQDDPTDEFATKTIEQIRVVDNDGISITWRTFRKQESDKKIIWVLHDTGNIEGVTEIPLVPFYVRRTGYFRGEPPLKGLAELNVTHWQSSSDQRTILHVTRVPILFASGFLDTEQLVVSAGTFTKASNEKATLSWVEHTGAAIKSGAEDLKDLEQQMQAYGLELVVPKGSNNSATGEVIDATRKATPLSMAADNLADCLEQCYVFAAQFSKINEEKAGTVIVKKDFAFNLSEVDLDILLKAVTLGIITKETWRNEAKRRGSLSADVDGEAEDEAIAEQDDTGLFSDKLDPNKPDPNKPDPSKDDEQKPDPNDPEAK